MLRGPPCTHPAAGPSTTADSLGPYLVLYVPPSPTLMRQWVLATCWALGSLGLAGSTPEVPGESARQAKTKP